MDKKACITCNTEFPATQEFFPFHSRVKPDGSRLLRTQCRNCYSDSQKVRQKRFREAHPDYNANWRKEHPEAAKRQSPAQLTPLYAEYRRYYQYALAHDLPRPKIRNGAIEWDKSLYQPKPHHHTPRGSKIRVRKDKSRTPSRYSEDYWALERKLHNEQYRQVKRIDLAAVDELEFGFLKDRYEEHLITDGKA